MHLTFFRIGIESDENHSFLDVFLASLPLTLLQNRCQKRRKTSIFGHARGWVAGLAGLAGWARASSNFIG